MHPRHLSVGVLHLVRLSVRLWDVRYKNDGRVRYYWVDFGWWRVCLIRASDSAVA